MANSKDSALIQYNIQQVFPGCRKLLLEEFPNCLSVVGLVTTNGETVNFGSSIMVTGQLEDWLNKMVIEMQESLKGALANAVDESVSANASDFATQVNMQVGVVALQFIWTREAQDALQKSKIDKSALVTASKKIASTYQNLVRLRQLRQLSWSGSQMKALEVFLATQSYLKDAIEEIIRKKVSQIGDFDWQRLARMYWNDEDRSCKASIGCKDFLYNFEYLKAEGRIFVFASTERAHYRMIQTLACFNGTLLMGLAETGKTETIKNLACFVGKMVQCIDCALN
jgi:dynein heavy chain